MRRTVSLSGARSRAVKGRFLWVIWAVFWSARAFWAALDNWAGDKGVRGVRIVFVILGVGD